MLYMTGLDDIAGNENSVRKIRKHLVKPLLDESEDAFTRAVFYGPPMNGKRFIAQKVAEELDLKFAQLGAYAEYGELVAVSESMTRRHLLFVDDLDVVAHRPVLRSSLSKVNPRTIVVGSTCRPWMLSQRLLPGFTGYFYIPEPDEAARKRLLNDVLEKTLGIDIEIIEYLDLDVLAKATKGLLVPEIRFMCEWAFIKKGNTCDNILSCVGGYAQTMLCEWTRQVKAERGRLDPKVYEPLLLRL